MATRLLKPRAPSAVLQLHIELREISFTSLSSGLNANHRPMEDERRRAARVINSKAQQC
jgi:hypothetical protein